LRLLVLAAAPLGCGRTDLALAGSGAAPAGDAASGTGGRAGGGGGVGGGGAGAGGQPELLGAPLTFAPTAGGFGLSVVLRSGDPLSLSARVRDEGRPAWRELGLAWSFPAADIAEWRVDGLQPGVRYQYEIRWPRSGGNEAARTLYSGSAVTARPPGSAFTFALVTDSHITPRNPVPIGAAADDFQERTLLAVTGDVRVSDPDFMLNLGDTLDFHLFGFNDPPPHSSWTRLGYLNYRRLLGDTLGRAAHFPVIGNWDGENGCNTEEEIQRSRSQRLIYLPGPRAETYPEGGSLNGDFYAFTWGDALFVVLNVMTYTPTCHLLGTNPGLPDDWTLGSDQLTWLSKTLAASTSRWKFLFIHHTVGGAAGNPIDSAYGRGGGQAAHVGEQGTVHNLMLRYGVQIFFYAHDHVFTDMIVDGIHYTLPGSAGAPWKFTQAETGYDQYWPDSGHARIAVGPTETAVELVAVGAKVLATYVIR
jgi:hypothetical protein